MACGEEGGIIKLNCKKESAVEKAPDNQYYLHKDYNGFCSSNRKKEYIRSLRKRDNDGITSRWSWPLDICLTSGAYACYSSRALLIRRGSSTLCYTRFQLVILDS